MDSDNKHGGIATGFYVDTVGASGRDMQVHIEKISHRHTIRTFDASSGRNAHARIKERVEHTGQRIWGLEYKPDWRQGTSDDQYCSLLLLSEWQQVWAAEGRDAPARWVSARDLVAGVHRLHLGFVHPKGSGAELVHAAPTLIEKYQNATVHELVLIDCESFRANDVLCRAASVSAPAPSKKRVAYPFKDLPLINFAPQPKTLSLVQAEIWYRQSATLLPRCVDNAFNDPVDRLQAALDLKHRMREVAAKALVDTKLRAEFIRLHPVPTLNDLLPDAAQIDVNKRAHDVDEAVQMLAAPGGRKYSEWTGGMESFRVWSEAGYWQFNGDVWVLTPGDLEAV